MKGGNTFPLQIMKLAIAAAITVTASPTVSCFFYTAAATTTGAATLTIDAADFFGDTGGPATELPALAMGVGSLAITVPAGSSILTGSPIVLEVANFAPTSTIDVQT
jgi:hypothetical protein